MDNNKKPDGTECSMIAFGKDQRFEVCYKSEMQAISGISYVVNGTETPASQKYSYKYTVYGEDEISISMERSGEVIYKDNEEVEDRTQCDFVDVDGVMCNSCEYCGNETYTVDCSNLPYGRMTVCESSMPVFFPLIQKSLEQKSMNDTPFVSSDPPSMLYFASDVPSVVPSDFSSDVSTDPPSDVSSDLSSILLSDVSSDVSSDIASGDGIECSIISIEKDQNFEVCFKAEMQAISGIGMFENGTQTAASQRYWYNYTIFGEYDISITMERSGEVQYTDKGEIDRTECDFVAIDGNVCSSCEYCGNDTYSVDCTNHPYGRKTKCESTFPVFFPLVEESLQQKSRCEFGNQTFIVKDLNEDGRE